MPSTVASGSESRQASLPPLAVFERAYLHAWLIALAVCWSPSKLLGYVAPWLAIGWLIYATRSGIVLRRVLIAVAGWAALIGAWALVVSDFVATSALLTLITYSCALFVLVVPVSRLSNPVLLERMRRPARWILAFEATYGIAQAVVGAARSGSFDIANGDAVQGTIFPFFRPENAFSNPMFAVNIAVLMLLILPPVFTRGKGVVPLALGGAALVLASVVHALGFLLVACILAVIHFRPPLPRRLISVAIVGCIATIPVIVAVAQRRNLQNLPIFAQVMVEGGYPRAEGVVRVLTRLPERNPASPWIGVGPGQFGSRAGLIGTGYFFGGLFNPRPLPLVPTGMTRTFREEFMDVWVRSYTMRALGSTHQPFFSWLSVWAEFGAVAFAGLVVAVAVVILRVRRSVRTNADRIAGMTFAAGSIFVFLLGLQENYWEVPQAIFPGVMMLMVVYATLVHRPSANGAATRIPAYPAQL